MTNNELMISDVARVDLVEDLKNPGAKMYTSIENDGTRETQIQIYNAINNVDKNIAECIGEVIECVNVVAHPVELVDEETGELKEVLRTILIAKDGTTYGAVSQGVASSLSKIFSIVGVPEGKAWEKNPVFMKFKQVKTRKGNNFATTIELVSGKK